MRLLCEWKGLRSARAAAASSSEDEQRRSSSSVGLLFRHLNISKEVPNTQGRDPTWSISISEFKRIWDFKREKNGQINGDLDPWDEAYFTRLMKSSAYSLDSLVVASYFPLTQCIEGLKVLVELLFGVTFRSIPLAPRESWHTDVLKMSLYHPEEGQLFQLMQRLERTTPHFIRCIKPNNVQSPGMYEQELVLRQLRCCGVLEVVRISRSGFPTRMTHQKFARRYGFLLLDNVASQDPLSVSVAILHQFNILPEMHQVGYTKLFFRTGQVQVIRYLQGLSLEGVGFEDLSLISCFI